MTIQPTRVVFVWLRHIPEIQGVDKNQHPRQTVHGKVITTDAVAITLDLGECAPRDVVIPWTNVSLVEVLPANVSDLFDV